MHTFILLPRAEVHLVPNLELISKALRLNGGSHLLKLLHTNFDVRRAENYSCSNLGEKV